MTGIEGAKREYSQFMFECKTYTFTYVVTYMLKVVFCWVADKQKYYWRTWMDSKYGVRFRKCDKFWVCFKWITFYILSIALII